MSAVDVLIIGGGLHGVSAALHLARRRRRVRVLEASRLAAHASGFSAGGVRTLGRHFAEVPLALEALSRWHRIREIVGDDCGFRVSAQVKVAESPAELATLEVRAATMRARSWTHEQLVDAAELRAILPAVAPHVTGGLVARQDGFAAPYRTTLAFAASARAAGAEVLEAARVVSMTRAAGLWHLRTADGARHSAPVLVNTAGAWGGRVARALGEDIPLGFNAFMMMLTARMPAFVGPVVGATGRPISFKQTETGQVMIGGGHKGVGSLDTGRVSLDIGRLAYSARTALELFPILQTTRVVHAWAGIEGVMPDEIPVIGLSRVNEGVVHAFGFSGHGFELAPVVGDIVAQLATERGTNHPIAAFAPDRFALVAHVAPGPALPQPAW